MSTPWHPLVDIQPADSARPAEILYFLVAQHLKRPAVADLQPIFFQAEHTSLLRSGSCQAKQSRDPRRSIDPMEAMLTVAPLQDQVKSVLSKSPYLSRKELRVEANNGHVRLEGTVDSFFQKQMAQELLRRVDGVEKIVNQLQVNWR